MARPYERRTRYTHHMEGNTHHFDAEGLHVAIDPGAKTLRLTRDWHVSGNNYLQSETLHYGTGEITNREKTMNGRNLPPEELPLDRYHFAAIYNMLAELPEGNREAIERALAEYAPDKWKGIGELARSR